MKRIKGAGNGGGRTYWWLLSARAGYSTYFAQVSGNGSANFYSSAVAVLFPLCFRIA